MLPVIKCQFEGVWRRFPVKPTASFDDISADCRAAFQLDIDFPVQLFYTDDEDDLILFTTRPELEDAKRFASSSSYALKLVMKPDEEEEEEEEEEEAEEKKDCDCVREKSNAVHTHVQCDGCGVNPIVGMRFKCVQCEDFDLCEKCEMKGVEVLSHLQSHAMLKMPRQLPLESAYFQNGAGRSIFETNPARSNNNSACCVPRPGCCEERQNSCDDDHNSDSESASVLSEGCTGVETESQEKETTEPLLLCDALCGIWDRVEGNLHFEVLQDGQFVFGDSLGRVYDVTPTAFTVDWFDPSWGCARFDLTAANELTEKGEIIWRKRVDETKKAQFPSVLVGVWHRRQTDLKFEVTEDGKLRLADDEQTLVDVTPTGFTMSWPNKEWGTSRFEFNGAGELLEDNNKVWFALEFDEVESECCETDSLSSHDAADHTPNPADKWSWRNKDRVFSPNRSKVTPPQANDEDLVASQLDTLNRLTAMGSVYNSQPVETAQLSNSNTEVSEEAFVNIENEDGQEQEQELPHEEVEQAEEQVEELVLTREERCLYEMGFTDTERNAQLLAENRNNVELALSLLLQ